MGCVRWGPFYPALHLLIHGVCRRGAEQGGPLVGLLGAGDCFFRGSQERRRGLVCRSIGEDLEAVGRSQALPPVEQTLPPAVALWYILLQNGEDISPAESQLVGAVGAIVVKCPRQECLWVGGKKKSLLLPLWGQQFQCHPLGKGRPRSPLPFYLLSSSPVSCSCFRSDSFLPVLGGLG